jgi:hypothetical protein
VHAVRPLPYDMTHYVSQCPAVAAQLAASSQQLCWECSACSHSAYCSALQVGWSRIEGQTHI